MPLIRRRRIPFSLKHMAQMSSTVIAHDFNSLHAKCTVLIPANSAWDCVEECGPATARLELVFGGVQWCGAASASVDAGRRGVLVIFANIWCLGSLLAKDAKLLYVGQVSMVAHSDSAHGLSCLPGLRMACHSSLDLLTGKDISCFGAELENREEKKLMDGV